MLLVHFSNVTEFVCFVSESGRTRGGARTAREVHADHQRRAALRLGSLRLRGAQQDRRPSEEHVPGY